MATGIATRLQLIDQMTAPIMAIQNAVSGLQSRFTTLDNAADIDASTLTQMQNQIALSNSAAQMLADTMQVVADNADEATAGQNGFNNSLRQGQSAADGVVKKVLAAVAAYASIQTIQKVIDLSDTLTQTTARLDLMNDGLQTTEELQNKIYQSTQRSRGAYTATAHTVAKLGVLAKNAFSSNDEMIAFAEQMNKQFVIGGSGIQEQTAAMYQLTQAMAAGKLQGDEFRSIMENAPMLAQAIADNMGKTTGELREMSSQGLITAEVIKSALFAAADETNARFENMPYTWAQVWQGASNALLMAFQPVLQWIGEAAGWIKDNWAQLEPVVVGLAAGVLGLVVALNSATIAESAHMAIMGAKTLATVAYNVVLGVSALMTGNAAMAQTALNTALMACPAIFIIAAIVAIIMAIYKWVQSVGGLKIAWLIAVNALMTAWDWVKIGFFTGVYWVIGLWDKMKLSMMEAVTAITNFMGDMKANVLMILQNMVNGAINIINGFIGILNKIPGVNIGLIEQVTFGTTAQLENEAAKQARLDDLAAYENEINAGIAGRNAALDAMKSDARAATEERLAGIEAAKAENAAKEETEAGFDYNAAIADNTAETAANTSRQADYSEEELKLWRDIAERDTINRFTTAEVTVDFGGVTNNVASEMDLDGIITYISEGVEETLLTVAEGVHE